MRRTRCTGPSSSGLTGWAGFLPDRPREDRAERTVRPVGSVSCPQLGPAPPPRTSVSLVVDGASFLSRVCRAACQALVRLQFGKPAFPSFRPWYVAQSKHAEARELMRSGALLFFSHGQQNSAADLSMLVLESLEKAEVEVVEELLESLAKLFSLMDPNSPERVAFVSRALKWSSGGSGKLGHPRLHQLLALTLWKEQNYCESRYHFLHSSDGEGCANMLVEYSTARGFRSEVDMFVAQAVLQFLCLKNKSSASVVFTTYTRKHPSIESGPPFAQPLLNFIWFLLLAVDGGKLTVFTVLCEQYQPSLRRDPMYNEYLDRIGQLFFGVPPKQTSSYGGLLGNLLTSLMGPSEHEGEDSQDDGSPIELD
ncbi:Golgi to ER traffic protein 4 homolog isoform X4 [Kogia breviceps]|uniref:Golgi to ER traffic protein 4 homolog isoform X4 n=1 Tax=Kogia breviceps TaxID=27615 RepID=UPI0034D252DE